jgi:hypothetical protein
VAQERLKCRALVNVSDICPQMARSLLISCSAAGFLRSLLCGVSSRELILCRPNAALGIKIDMKLERNAEDGGVKRHVTDKGTLLKS